jgi:hypothetical protein
MNDVTRLLMAAEQGEQDAAEQLLNVVYAELHQMAEQKLRRCWQSHTPADGLGP